MKKALPAICLLGVTSLAFAAGHVSAESPGAPRSASLTGRTDQNLTFVTELDDGVFRWFDTNLRATCSPSRHFDFYWNSLTARSPYRWDGRRLRVHAAGPTNDGEDAFVADLDATYSPATGLRGTIEVSVESEGNICRTGKVGFWAVADR